MQNRYWIFQRSNEVYYLQDRVTGKQTSLRTTSRVEAERLSQGIPKNSVLKYETAIKSGKFVIIAHGTTLDATRARDIISGTNPEAVEHHELSPAEAKAELAAV